MTQTGIPASGMDEPYENTLSIETLRREVRRGWDLENQFIKALKDLPEMPPVSVMTFLGNAGKWPDDWQIGTTLQRKHGQDIPFKTECEVGAGLWHRIRTGLLASAKPAEPTP